MEDTNGDDDDTFFKCLFYLTSDAFMNNTDPIKIENPIIQKRSISKISSSTEVVSVEQSEKKTKRLLCVQKFLEKRKSIDYSKTKILIRSFRHDITTDMNKYRNAKKGTFGVQTHKRFISVTDLSQQASKI